MERICFVFGLLGLVVLCGCQGEEFRPIGAISGTLKLNGELLPEKTKVIFMHPTDGYAGFGFTDEAGKFDIEWRRSGKVYEGLPIGDYEVMVAEAAGLDIDSLSADEMLEGRLPPRPKATIPRRYLRAKTSGLKYTIQEGENSFDIQLEARK